MTRIDLKMPQKDFNIAKPRTGLCTLLLVLIALLDLSNCSEPNKKAEMEVEELYTEINLVTQTPIYAYTIKLRNIGGHPLSQFHLAYPKETMERVALYEAYDQNGNILDTQIHSDVVHLEHNYEEDGYIDLQFLIFDFVQALNPGELAVFQLSVVFYGRVGFKPEFIDIYVSDSLFGYSDDSELLFLFFCPILLGDCSL